MQAGTQLALAIRSELIVVADRVPSAIETAGRITPLITGCKSSTCFLPPSTAIQFPGPLSMAHVINESTSSYPKKAAIGKNRGSQAISMSLD